MSEKKFSKASGQGLYIALACALVIVGTVFAYMNPYSAIGRTLKTAEVSDIELHLAEEHQVIFTVVVPVSNPSNVPVTITGANVRMWVNGTDYHSRTIAAGLYVVLYPGETFYLQKIVELLGSPIGFQPRETMVYTLRTEVEIHGEAESLGMSSSNSYSFADTRTWTYTTSPYQA